MLFFRWMQRVLSAVLPRRLSFVSLATAIFVTLTFLEGFSGKVARALTFEPVQNLSSDPGSSDFGGTPPQLAASGSNVYVVWQDSTPGNSGLLFRRSTDSGVTWDPALDQPARNLSVDVVRPTVFASDSNVYVVWPGSSLFLRRSTDGGQTFQPVQDLGANIEFAKIANWKVAVAGSQIYIAWTDSDGFQSSVRFRHSNDAGATWDPPLGQPARTLSANGAGTCCTLNDLAVNSINVYVALVDNGHVAYFLRSIDAGITFAPAQNLGLGRDVSQIIVDGANVYLFALAQQLSANPFSDDVVFRRSTDGGASWIPSLDQPAAGGSPCATRAEMICFASCGDVACCS